MATRSGAAGSAPDRWARRSAATPRPAVITVSYWCANGHETRPELRRASGPAVPETWDCPRCGFPAGQDQDEPAGRRRKVEPYKTHLAYVKERRSDADGEAILDEALQQLRDRGLIR